MKKLLTTSLVLLIFFSANQVRGEAGSSFGVLTTAESVGMGHGMFSGFVALVDNTSFGGSFTYGLSRFTDARFKLAMVDNVKGSTELAFGADFKYQFMVMDSISNSPFDMAVGGLFEYMNREFGSVFQIGGQLIASFPTKLSSGSLLIPYGRINFRSEKVSIDAVGTEPSSSNSNLEIGLNGGVKWEVTKNVSLFGEFQFDGNDGLVFGIDFNSF